MPPAFSSPGCRTGVFARGVLNRITGSWVPHPRPLRVGLGVKRFIAAQFPKRIPAIYNESCHSNSQYGDKIVSRLNRILSLLAVAFFLVCPTSPQTSTAAPNLDNLYFKALSASISEMGKSWAHIDDSDHGSSIRTDYHHVVVAKNSLPSDNLPEQFGDYRIEYLDADQLVARYKKLRKPFAVLEIGSMQGDSATLKVSISKSWFSYKKGHRLFEVEEGSEVTFRFDCETQRFVVSNVKLWGV